MRIPSSLSRVNAVSLCLLVGALSQPLSAQEGGFVVMRTSATSNSVRGSLPVSDETLSALLVSSHIADAIAKDPELNTVVLVVDANEQYVSSSLRHATVATRTTADTTTCTPSDSAPCAKVMLRQHLGEMQAEAMGGFVIAKTSTMSSGGAETHSGVFGTDVPMQDVGGMGFKIFPAGQLGTTQLTVMVVKLK